MCVCVFQSACNINLKTLTDLTALHVAAHEGHATGVELLVGYGADLNVAVDNGNTALHLILAKNNMKPLDCNTPYTLQVNNYIECQIFNRCHFKTCLYKRLYCWVIYWVLPVKITEKLHHIRIGHNTELL